MSRSSNIAHGYQPTTADGTMSAYTPLRINKRITAKPTTFPPHPRPDGRLSVSDPPMTVRLALKTTYNLSVPSWITLQSESLGGGRTTLSFLELAERGKQILKHAEVLRSQTGRMKLRVKCVIDGQHFKIQGVQDAFVRGLQQVSASSF
ncbi:hypothetical protein NCC49_005456 [Naganishia albida]|nr:hypothetical protein NCC49_005456 [Naganishia albida]